MSKKWQVDEADDNVGGVEKIRHRPRGEEPRGARRDRKDRGDNVAAEVIPEGGSIQMTGKPRTTTEQVRTAFGLPPTPPTGHTPESDKESCPVCGRLKWKFFEKEVDDGAKKQIPVLVCGDCTEAYKAYRAATLASNAKAMLADPTAPEPEGPVDKFHWVLSKIDLEQFEAEAEAAITAYRATYEKAVVEPMMHRSYLDKWEWMRDDASRPKMRFTPSAYRDGTAEAMRNVAEESATELRNLRFIMRRTVGRLAVASRVKSELEAKLAAQPAEAPAES